MKRNFIVSFVGLFIALTLHSQQKNDWENPSVIGINKLNPRATMYSFKNESDALSYDRKNTDRVVLLNGDWNFNFSKNPNEAPKNFLENSFTNWSSIKVPTNWEMQGFGTRIYTNAKHPWEHQNWPKISEVDNPVGIYKKTFDLPTNWDTMDIRIHFAGVTSAFYLWVNGKKIGYSQGSRTPAEFDITAALNKGENTIILKVFRWSDGAYIESQDGWRLSGIHRDVLLLAEPKIKITDFTVRTNLDSQYKDAVLEISPELVIPNEKNASEYKLTAKLYDGTAVINEETISAEKWTKFWYNQRFAPEFNLINLKIENPKKWSAEFPNLYTLVLSLKDKKGKTIESKSTRVGFRKFEAKGGVLAINGKPIKLYGVNRHDHNAKTGKTVSVADMRRDMELLKSYNFNAVRTSHYPNNVEFYDLCDEYGIYVMDEANVESHGVRGGGGELASHPEWTTSFVDRVVRMYERDKNHPSIFSWSLGNESGVGSNHSAMAGYLKWKDPERLIHYEPAGSAGGKLSPQSKNTPNDPFDFTDMISRMYPSPKEFAEMDASQLNNKPVISCEYTHAMGNSNGGLKIIWDIIHASKRISGAFIWDWMDQGILVNKDDCEQYAYGGYFGDKINDGNFCLNGVINSDQTIKPVMNECKYVFQPFTFTKFNQANMDFVLSNRTSFTNTKAYTFTYEILENGKIINNGTLKNPNLAGGALTKVKIPSIAFKGNNEYFINIYAKNNKATLWSKAGYIVASEQFALAYKSVFETQSIMTGKLTAEDTSTNYVVKSTDFTAVFNKSTGYLEKVTKKGKTVISSSIKPNFWRATTDNDRAVIKAKKGINLWKEATFNQKLERFETQKTDKGTYIINTVHNLANSGMQFKMEYSILLDGTIDIVNSFFAPRGLENLPRIGIQTGIASNLTAIEWYGKGPHENYVDRNDSAFVGLYKTDLKGLGTQFVYPQANANRTDTRWATFTDASGSGLKVIGNFEFSAYEQTLENLERATYKCELVKANAITLNLDHKQQGVGGYNSWSLKAAPLPEHSIISQNYVFKFVLQVL